MEFSAQSIRNHVGSASFERGRNYFTSGNVLSVTADKNRISGRVRGSRQTPYETKLILKEGVISDSDCSCPVGCACKHVAALGLASLLEFAKNPPSSKSEVEIAESKHINALRKISQSVPAVKKEEQQNWQQTVSQLLSFQRVETERCFQLQLLLKIERQYPLFAKNDNFCLVVRPRLFDPKTKKFSVTEIKWSDADYSSSIYWEGIYGSLPQNQLVFLKLLATGLDSRYPGGWEEIDEEKAGYFWHILSQYKSYGVDLLGGNKGQIPVIISPEPVETKLEISEKGSNLVIAKKIFYQGKDVTSVQMAFVGKTPAFAAELGINQYTLYPLASGALPDKILDTPLTVPQKDIPKLQKDFLGNLAGKFAVVSRTKVLALPKLIYPKPHVLIVPTRGRAVEISLGFTHQDVTFPLYDTPDTAIINSEPVLLDKQAVESGRREVELAFGKYEEFEPDELGIPDIACFSGIRAARFIAEILPVIRSEIPGCIVTVSEKLPDFNYEENPPEILLRIDENEDAGDWFDLGISVTVGKEEVPFQSLFQALVQGEKYLLLQSGKYFSLERKEFDKLRSLLAEAKSIQDKDSKAIRLSRFQVQLWDELAKTGIVTAQAKRWQETMEGLLSVKGVVIQKPPPKFQAVLRSYQTEGYSWLVFLRKYKLGGILADDMGLGKTIQTIALIVKTRFENSNKKPFLVVAPTSVVENWDMELNRFAPFLKTVIMRSGDRSKQFAEIGKADVVVISYALLIRDFEQVKEIAFDTLILDEAQMVKNYQSKAYSLVRKLKVDCKLALTGTPLENNLMELWSIFSIVAPGLLPSPDKFRENYKTPIEKYQNREVLDKLKKRIRPFLLRRQKSVVETQLPAKNEQVLRLALNDAHRRLYDLQLQHERKRVLGMLQDGGLKDHRFEILRSLTRLRQACLHPRLLDEKHINVSATKIDSLKEQLEEVIAGGHKVLIFSQFTSFLTHVREMLENADYKYLYLAGETKNRGKLIEQFHKDSSVQIFLISLKAGGFGLNLTAADYCILLDPWWNPAVEAQAVDRTHRIGQTKPVFVYKFIAKDTIEEKVLMLQEKKRKLFQNVLDEEAFFSTMISEDDIKNIFVL